jgi:formate-dependent nitrite reductase membrane component NrfD
MTSRYSTGVRFIRTFGTLEVVSFVGEGIGGVLYLVGVATQRLVLEALGVACLILAVLVLRAHLGQPTRGWRAVTKVASAWVSRGTLVIALFTGASAASIGAALLGGMESLGSLATTAAVVLAFPVVIYAGMMLRSMTAIRLWNGPFLPLSFSAHSAASGLAIAFAIAAVTGQGLAGWICPAAIVALLAAAVFSFAHLKSAPDSAGAKASLERIQSGDMARQFSVGAVVLGLVVPLAALGIVALTGAMPAVLGVVAAVARAYGDFAYRHAIVTGGAYDPIWPSDARYFARANTTAPSAGRV